jgi:hypothetical protein
MICYISAIISVMLSSRMLLMPILLFPSFDGSALLFLYTALTLPIFHRMSSAGFDRYACVVSLLRPLPRVRVSVSWAELSVRCSHDPSGTLQSSVPRAVCIKLVSAAPNT